MTRTVLAFKFACYGLAYVAYLVILWKEKHGWTL